MDTLQQNIKDLLVNSPENIHSIFYAKKTKNGIKTDEDALVYFVDEKLPLELIPRNEIIPSTLNIENIEYKTDVLQEKRFVLNQCYNLNSSQVLALQTRIRPLSGGIEISDLSSWVQSSPYSFSLGVGTLGFLAIDNVDNTLVGVTNNHVIIKDASLTNERNIFVNVYTNINSPVVFSSVGGYNATLPPTVLQFDHTGGRVNFTLDSIGCAKRYVPLSQYDINTVDGALIAIRQGNTDSSSSSQAFINNTFAMPFASTSEVTSLSTTPISIYSVGRSTGPKGENCPMYVWGSGSIQLYYNKQGTQTIYTMSDIFAYAYQDTSNLPIWSGDSGSAVIGDFDGTYKIVGLAFAGNTRTENGIETSEYGIASRIDNVAAALNISAWDGGDVRYTNTTTVSAIYRPSYDNRPSIVYNGKTYFQAGLISTNKPFTDV
jgi:hypothetical protein